MDEVKMKKCPTCKSEVTQLFYGECFQCYTILKDVSIKTSASTKEDEKHGGCQNYCQTIYANKD
jgi:hypothetical protein